MVGTAVGAGRRERAVKVAWVGAAIAGGLTELIGIAAALYPAAWLGLFGNDPGMIEIGSRYLRIVGPFYGFFGGGLALYFASQGAGRLGWPLLAAALRFVLAAAAGWIAVHVLGSVDGLFLSLGLAMVAFGGVIAAAILGGAWDRGRAAQTKPISGPALRPVPE
jgi:Na+-driven multidrug efflux pump